MQNERIYPTKNLQKNLKHSSHLPMHSRDHVPICSCWQGRETKVPHNKENTLLYPLSMFWFDYEKKHNALTLFQGVKELKTTL